MLTISKFTLFILLLLQNILLPTLPYFPLWHFLVSEIKWFVFIFVFIYYLFFLLIHLQKRQGLLSIVIYYYFVTSKIQDGRIKGCTLIFPARTPKSQTVAKQPLTGKCWIPPKKDTPHTRAKEKPQQDDRRGTVTFKVKSQTSQRCSEGTNKTLCTPGPREWVSDFHKRLNQTWLWVFECILQRHSSAVTCVELGTLAATDLKDMVWHAFIWRISPLDPV